ncbi:MAG: type II secretion system F family protein [Candidatus Aenigmatarchaeota archaeon]
MRIKMKSSTKVIILLVIIGVSIYLYNFFTIFYLPLTLLSIGVVIAGPALFEYKRYKENKEIEERFPDFLRDVTENVKTGMTLTQAITATKNTYYGALTPHIKKITTKIDWSIPFDEVLKEFSKQTTPLIQKTVSTIIETYAGGGDITQILEASGKTIKEINKLRRERFSAIYNQMITGYVIFFIFIGVLIILQKYLIPSLFTVTAEEIEMVSLEEASKQYHNIFQWLILIEGFFSGLVIGKMAEGNLLSGLKHSLLLIAIGYGAFLLFM